MTEKEQFITKVSMVVENAQELVDLIEKAQQQAAELKNTLYKIESFNPKFRPEQ